MSADTDCQDIRGLTAKVALGVADGEDRARVLDHVVECPECRQELEDLTALADDLVVLAPEHEPPLGFELRTIRGLQRKRERQRRWRLPAVAFAAAPRSWHACPTAGDPEDGLAAVADVRQECLERTRDSVEVERLDHERRVPGLPGAAPEEAPKLGLDRLSPPLRLLLEGTEGRQLPALGQHGLDTGRAECSDQLAFEIGIAGVEAEVLEVVR